MTAVMIQATYWETRSGDRRSFVLVGRPNQRTFSLSRRVFLEDLFHKYVAPFINKNEFLS